MIRGRLSAHGVQLLCTPTADSYLFVVYGKNLMCCGKNVNFNCLNCSLKIGYFLCTINLQKLRKWLCYAVFRLFLVFILFTIVVLF